MEAPLPELLIDNLINLLDEISSISDYKCPIKKQYYNLARKLKLLMPMFEEFKEIKDRIPEDTVKNLTFLQEALDSAKDFLRFGSEASRIYLVLEREEIMLKFQEVTAQLEQSLSGISYNKLDISDEVKEQVDLVLTQFRRAKGRVDTPDVELYEDLSSVYNKSFHTDTDRAVLRRLAEKLQLMGIADLKQESLAMYDMVVASGGDPGESIEKISIVLKKIKDFVWTESVDLSCPAIEKCTPSSCSGQSSIDVTPQSPLIPNDFRCPISLELMIDPVIVSTGQTYERDCIKKWIEAGHYTCPKTQQSLSSTTLTPNYVLRSLIAQWCETNGVEVPKKVVDPQQSDTLLSLAEHAKIDILLRKLTSSSLEDQRCAAGELRLLAKRNTENRVSIAKAGVIPVLIGLLSAADPLTQEHAVTTLLNLSICENNKTTIIFSGAIPGIVYVLKKGSMEARENAAATLFSLSVVDQNKVIIGASGAIPALVTLLDEGRHRGKKDAATALFNLCIYQGNKGRAVSSGIVPILLRLLTETGDAMVDEALAILAVLASHPEAKAAIAAAKAVVVLVNVIGNASPRNRENAAAVLVHLCAEDKLHLSEAKELGVMDPLLDLAQNGTDRGKRKAIQLLERMDRLVEQQKLAEAQAQALAQDQAICPQLPS